MQKVLVLDDDRDIAFVVKIILDKNGYKAKCITDYKKLETTLISFQPEVLILDISLGGADGRYLCKKIKSTQYGENIRVILFSANLDASHNYNDYNAQAFIPKPFESNTLIDTLQALLE